MGAWSLAGNALGASPTAFLGTTDNNALVVQTGNPSTERLRVDPSGNVGIGTAAPTAALHLGLGKGLRIEGGTSTTDANDYFSFGGYGTFGIDAPGAANGRFVVQKSGNVGIGTSAPVSTLHVNGALTLSPQSDIVLASGAFGSVVGSILREVTSHSLGGVGAGLVSRGSELAFYTNPLVTALAVSLTGTPPPPLPGPTERLRIDCNGQVGIGTSSPGFALHLASGLALRIEGGTNAADTTNYFSFGGLGTFGVDAPGVPNGRFVVLNNGNVGVGSPNPNFALHLPVGKTLRIEGGTSAADAADYFSFGGNGSFGIDAPGVPDGRFVVQNSGNVGIGTNAPSSRLHVNGDVTVTGDIFLAGADCAEHFDAAGEPPQPGTVVVIDEQGALRESREAYDKKVAGIVSGAGEYRHALVLDKRPGEEGRIPVALVGKVYCKVDAGYSPIEVGDLLTTSGTPGHAMKATEPQKAFGCVIGKALRAVKEGQSLIPILVALQ